ncbi:DNA alkylation repair protein [Lentilactobacillus kribbianus]|uniref:DNA alkylation repair protein n=1 Tax=Lentilactobacillus kribbianus TaxID=2729622 RepID=UPI001553FFFC|nr:DNA alkylation repair protein [Lentilactobacillus kribbianus]
MDFELMGDPNNRKPMANYMRDQFVFAGVKAKARQEQAKPLIKASKSLAFNEIKTLIANLYARSEREYQYTAIDVAVANVRRFNLAELQALLPFVTQKAWWDTVDSWRKVLGLYIARHQEDKATVFSWLYQQDDFWLRRLSIILQLTEKEKTDQIMLTQAIENDLNTDEFFIQKAIGWALRQYSKLNPNWVADFIADHQLSKLAVHEGSKYLNK